MARVFAAACLVVAFACSGAFASEPGQPLDCSDWVFLVPGLSCTTIAPFAEFWPNSLQEFLFRGVQREVDNAGDMFVIRGPRGIPGAPGQRAELVRFDGQTETVVAYIADRSQTAVPGTRYDEIRVTGFDCRWYSGQCPITLNQPYMLQFDRIHGRFIIALNSVCADLSQSNESRCATNTYDGWWIAGIDGFAPLLEIFQSYVPQTASVGFTVPLMPEGMSGADHFDTYWGNLTHPLDFTQAHGLQCNYPAAAPHVGDYVTVADTLPDPTPGTGRYYVTAATYQGATRYGRKTTAGHLSGRDPAVLPVCVNP